MKKIAVVLVLISLLMTPANATSSSDSIRYKDTHNQIIKHNKWVTLKFNGKTSIKGNGKRSLFCYQVGLKMKGKKKPSYVKVRFTRLKHPLDTTATNITFVKNKPVSEYVTSNCWEITSKSPVVVQIRITGGSSTYTSDIRQFKMWTPGADYPSDFSDYIPIGTI
jgi:hypothetical protein